MTVGDALSQDDWRSWKTSYTETSRTAGALAMRVVRCAGSCTSGLDHLVLLPAGWLNSELES